MTSASISSCDIDILFALQLKASLKHSPNLEFIPQSGSSPSKRNSTFLFCATKADHDLNRSLQDIDGDAEESLGAVEDILLDVE
jgi:hypothetical protein